jgi:hypothetical protein
MSSETNRLTVRPSMAKEKRGNFGWIYFKEMMELLGA